MQTAWQLFNQATTLQTRPSELLGVTDVFMAFCLDSAIYSFGTALQNELDGVEGKNKNEIKRKRERILGKWLGLEQKFREPGMVGSGKKAKAED